MTQAEKISLNRFLKEQYLEGTGLKTLSDIWLISSKAGSYLKLLEERSRFECLFFFDVFKKLYSHPRKFHKYFDIKTIVIEPLAGRNYCYNRIKQSFSFHVGLINQPESIPEVISGLQSELDFARHYLQLHFIDFGGTISQSGEIGRGYDKNSRFTGLVENLKQEITENDFHDIFKYSPNSYRFKEVLSEKLVFHKALKISTDSSNIGDLKILLFFKKLIFLMHEIEKALGNSSWPQKICVPLIVGHGTDTVERTSNYVHWFFSLCKSGYPVKYRGSSRKFFDKGVDFKVIYVTAHTPHGLPNSDAFENLKDALKFAGRLINKVDLPEVLDTVLIASGKIIAFFSKGITELPVLKKREIIFDSTIPQIAQGIERISLTGKKMKTFNLKTLPDKIELKLDIPLPETDVDEILIPSSFAYVEHHMVQYTPNDFLENLFVRLSGISRKKKTAVLLEGELNKAQIRTVKKFLSEGIFIFILSGTKNCKKWMQPEIDQGKVHLFSYVLNGENLANRIRFFFSIMSGTSDHKIIELIRGVYGDEEIESFDHKLKFFKPELPNFPVIQLKVFQNFTSVMIEDASHFLEKFTFRPQAVIYEGYGDGHIPLEDFTFGALVRNYFQKKFQLKLSIPGENLYETFFYLHGLGFEKSQVLHYLREIISRGSKKLAAIYSLKKNYIRQFMTVKPKDAYASLEKYAIGQLLYFMGMESPGIGFEDNDLFIQVMIRLYSEKIPKLIKDFNVLNLKLYWDRINFFLYNLPIRILFHHEIPEIIELFKFLHMERELAGKKIQVLGVDIEFEDVVTPLSTIEAANLLKYADSVRTYFEVSKIQVRGASVRSGFFKQLSFPYECGGQYYPDYFIYLKCIKNPFEKRGIRIGNEEQFFIV